ncbi:uncharacterized protein LOC120142284 [Hibiscus syriacus]|uniref:uncharacterized protein LOC120142284 n=1 Tax=Hibiscus syriacus TaxID=106335 RepID=UPI0019223862|nr:uncharacterized protein LOC120142284 [Hibiscus syriacus]
MGSMNRSGFCRKNCSARFIITTTIGAVFGLFVGVSFPSVSLDKIPNLPSSLGLSVDVAASNSKQFYIIKSSETTRSNISKIYVPTNPRGAESLPPGIVVPETDLYPRRLWGDPSEDLKKKPKYLATFTVGIDQMVNIDKCVKKFSEDFQILLFHYDGRTTEWDRLEWSKNAIHVSARKQTKWWYAKRFLHPDIVSAYEYIFIWDEDLGVQNFNADRYIKLVKKHGLEISQPGLEPNYALTWQMTKRRADREVHKFTKEKPGWCSDPRFPPCAAFVEIMAPVFSREAWRCVWYLIQNDLVHGWGLDFALRRCVTPAHEKIGVVDSEWIVHQVIPTLGNQGEPHAGISPRDAVRIRSKIEWAMFQKRIANADLEYIAQLTNAKG